MKNSLYLILLALLGFYLPACKYSNKVETVNVKNEFTMSVPDYLSVADNLKEGADFQYSNRYRNMYAVVFSDKKDKDYQTFYHEQIGGLKKALDKPMVNDSVSISIPGAKGVHTEIAGKMGDEMVYYSVITWETKDKYYQECVWTRGEDRKLKYGKDIEKILLSFKLIHS